MTQDFLDRANKLDDKIYHLSCLIECIQESTCAKLYRKSHDNHHGTIVPDDLFEHVKKEMVSRYTEQLDKLKQQFKELCTESN